jgi:uncharacterized protein (DUF952 family)
MNWLERSLILLACASLPRVLVASASPPGPQFIYSVLDVGAWDRAMQTGWYDGGEEAKKSNSQIHCARIEQMLFVLQSFFANASNVTVAKVNVSQVMLPARVVWVGTVPGMSSFPHIEGGSLAVSAVAKVTLVRRTPANEPWRNATVCDALDCWKCQNCTCVQDDPYLYECCNDHEDMTDCYTKYKWGDLSECKSFCKPSGISAIKPALFHAPKSQAKDWTCQNCKCVQDNPWLYECCNDGNNMTDCFPEYKWGDLAECKSFCTSNLDQDAETVMVV